MDIANDLTIFYAGWPAQSVTWAPRTGQGGSGRAVFNEHGSTILGVDVVAIDPTLTYPSATFPEVKRGDSFTIAGLTWVARENPQPSQDGLESTVPLERSA